MLSFFKSTLVVKILKALGQTQTINSQTITVTRRNSAGLIVEAYGTAAASTQNGNALYAKDARYFKTDASNGVTGEYRNTGTAAVSAFTLLEGAESTVTSVTAGNGLTGGGTEGALTINAVAGNGIQVGADSISAQGANGIVVEPSGISVGVPIYNTTGGTLTPGTLVYLSGFNATDGITVTKADADGAAPATHVVVTSINNNASGTVYPVARAINVDTSGRTIGDLVFLDATTAGGFAFSAPTGANQIVQVVGIVKVVDATVGEIEFFPGIRQILEFGTQFLQDGAVTQAKLAANEALTATADGTGSGAMTGVASHAVVTSAAATNQISLPASSAALIGKQFTLWVGANGFELITPASSNATINNVDSDGTNQADIPANSLSRLTLVDTNKWLLENIGQDGAVAAAITPDND